MLPDVVDSALNVEPVDSSVVEPAVPVLADSVLSVVCEDVEMVDSDGDDISS